MSSSAASTSSAVVCGVSQVGIHVVRTEVARRAAGVASQSTEQVRPIAELQAVAVLQSQPPQLVVALVPGVDEGVGDREERVRAAGVDGEPGLVEPGVDRDLPRRHPVVAQRYLDHAAAALGVVVAVDTQHDLVVQRVRLRHPGNEVGDGDRRGDLDGRALVAAQAGCASGRSSLTEW